MTREDSARSLLVTLDDARREFRLWQYAADSEPERAAWLALQAALDAVDDVVSQRDERAQEEA